jgi:hypothetical protein
MVQEVVVSAFMERVTQEVIERALPLIMNLCQAVKVVLEVVPEVLQLIVIT